MYKSRILTALVALSALTAGCKPPAALSPAVGSATTAVAQAPVSASGIRRVSSDTVHTLNGVVQLPASRQVQATTAQVVNAATLQLLDANGVTMATGVTSNGGSGNETFTLSIPTTFQPTVGQVFILEAVKGLSNNVPGSEAVRLRTLLQWTASGWTSITGSSTIAITAMTTAVALISSIDPTNVPGSSAMGKVTYSGGNSTFSGSITGYTATDVNKLTQSVNAFVSADSDPVGNIGRVLPQITGMSSNKGAVGDMVAVFGDGFNPTSGIATVSFNGTSAVTYMLRSRTALYVAVPSGATSGNVSVQMPNGTSNTMPFTVTSPPTTAASPQILGLSKNVVRRGDLITLTGYNFDPTASQNTITYNGGTVVPTSGNAGSVTFTVPNNASSGPLTITNNNGTSGAFYLGVITTSLKAIVEPFTNTATIDLANSSLTVTNGVGAAYNAPYSWAQCGTGPAPTPGSGAQYSFGQTNADTTWFNTMSGTYPKGHGVGLLKTTDNAIANSNGCYWTDTRWWGWPQVNASTGLATNGKIALTVYHSNPSYMGTAQLFMQDNDEAQQFAYHYQGFPFQDQGGYLQGTIAGLADSDYFYWIPGGQASFNTIQVMQMIGHTYKKLPPINLPASLGSISRLGGTSYGYRLGSNGSHLFIWGGNANAPYNSSSQGYIYEFGVSTDGLTLYFIRAFAYPNNYQYPVDNNAYAVMGVDDRDEWANISNSYYTQATRLSDGAYLSYSWSYYCYNGNNWASYVQQIWDGNNDCYYTVRPDQSWQHARLVVNTSVYTTTQNTYNVVTPTITLPAGQVWNTLRMKWTLPNYTWGKVQVLKASDNSVLAEYQTDPVSDTGGQQVTPTWNSKPIDRTFNLQGNANFNGVTQVKLRAYLNTNWAYTTPYLTYWGITGAYSATTQNVTSGAYDTGVTSGDVTYMSYAVDQPAGAPALNMEFSESPDGTNWGPWVSDVTKLSRRYVRWRATVPQGNTYTGTYLSRVEIDYQN